MPTDTVNCETALAPITSLWNISGRRSNASHRTVHRTCDASPRLALHRHHLEARARTVPVGLILAWAKFGRVEHATHLARTLPDATRRAQAIAQLAEACSERGDLDVAGTLLDQAQDLLPQVADDGLREQITVALAWTAERIGQPARADDLVARILSTEERFVPRS